MKKPVAILGALDDEIKRIMEISTPISESQWSFCKFYVRTLDNVTIVMARSGVGKVLAAAVVQHLIDTFDPSVLIYTGVAGAINPDYQPGDVVISNDLIQHDFDATGLGCKRGEIPYTNIHILEADKNLIEKAKTFKADSHDVYLGRILTGDEFITASHRQSHKYLIEELQGDAVEMEGASAALVAKLNSVPFVVIRTISDRANSDAQVDFERLLPLVAANSVGIVRHILRQL